MSEVEGTAQGGGGVDGDGEGCGGDVGGEEGAEGWGWLRVWDRTQSLVTTGGYSEKGAGKCEETGDDD